MSFSILAKRSFFFTLVLFLLLLPFRGVEWATSGRVPLYSFFLETLAIGGSLARRVSFQTIRKKPGTYLLWRIFAHVLTLIIFLIVFPFAFFGVILYHVGFFVLFWLHKKSYIISAYRSGRPGTLFVATLSPSLSPNPSPPIEIRDIRGTVRYSNIIPSPSLPSVIEPLFPPAFKPCLTPPTDFSPIVALHATHLWEDCCSKEVLEVLRGSSYRRAVHKDRAFWYEKDEHREFVEQF